MKKIILILSVVVMLVSFSACNKYEKQIIGSWSKTVASIVLTAEFTDGGSANFTYGAYHSNGTYSIDDNEISISTGDCTGSGVYTMAIDGDVLTMQKVSDDCPIRKDILDGVYDKN